MRYTIIIDAPLVAQKLSGIPYSIKEPGQLTGKLLIQSDKLVYFIGDYSFIVPVTKLFETIIFSKGETAVSPFFVDGITFFKLITTYKGKVALKFSDLSESGGGNVLITDSTDKGRGKNSGFNFSYFDADKIEVGSIFGFKLEEDSFIDEFTVPVEQVSLFDASGGNVSCFSYEDSHHFAYTTADSRFVASKGFKFNTLLDSVYIPQVILKTIATFKDKVYYATNENAIGFSFNGTMFVVIPLTKSSQDKEKFLAVMDYTKVSKPIDLAIISHIVERTKAFPLGSKDTCTISLADMDTEWGLTLVLKGGYGNGTKFFPKESIDYLTWECNILVNILYKIFPHYTQCFVQSTESGLFFIFIKQDGSFILTYSG